ncbi:MAG: hypothetical protein WDN26_24280 [Chitinophagaceae bacterium]
MPIHNNSITGNTVHAIRNASSASVNATCNWYGSASLASMTPTITGTVTYIPYLTDGTDASGSTPGFQPSVTCTPSCDVAKPTAGTITQPTCTTPTGSVVLNNLPAGNWTIQPAIIPDLEQRQLSLVLILVLIILL